MITIGDKEYLNLQEQVWKNAESIRCLASGLKITGTGQALPPSPEDLDAFLLQQDGKTYLYIYFDSTQGWSNLGEFPAVGPQGVPGPQGDAAIIGSVECSTETISAGDSAHVSVDVQGTNLFFSFEIPRGAVGAQGPRGERGVQGPVGPQGPQGQQGNDGASIQIVGSVSSYESLPDPETVAANYAFLVGVNAPYNLYVAVGASGSREWVNAGPVTPQNVIVDSALNATSQHPVENRVVTLKFDSLEYEISYLGQVAGTNAQDIQYLEQSVIPDIFYELADLKEIVFETIASSAAYVVDPASMFVTPFYVTIDNTAYPVIDETDAEVAEVLGSSVVEDGEIVSFVFDTVQSVGVNQWDEICTFGKSISISSGNLYDNNNSFTSSFIRVIENISYYLYAGSGQPEAYYVFFDKDKQFISGGGWTRGNTRKPPQNCEYIRFSIQGYGATYKNDVCLNVSNAAINNTYRPYTKKTLQPLFGKTSEERTLRSAGTARDSFYVRDDGNDAFSIVKRNVIGSYTFTGSENIVASDTATSGLYRWAFQGLSSLIKKPSSNSETANILFPLYEAKPSASGGTYYLNTGISCSTDGYIFVYDPDFNSNSDADKAGLLAKLAGKTLYYENASSTETVLKSGLLYNEISFPIQKGGTINLNGGSPDALPGIEVDIPVKRFQE